MKNISPIMLLTLLILSGCKTMGPLQFNYSNSDEHYDFIYNKPDNPYLVQLRTEFQLDEITAGCTSEFEKIRVLSAWVNNLWDHDGSNMPEKSDPISILHEVQNGSRFRCVEYAIVLNGCLNAMGIPSRTLGLKTKDVETRTSGAGHVVLEAYDKELNKWIMADPQWDAVPVLNGTPLNAVEFQKAIVHNKDELVILSANVFDKNYYCNWIDDYLFYFNVSLDNRVVDYESSMSLMLVPIGAKNPEVFQKKWPITNMLYTNSVCAFYTEP